MTAHFPLISKGNIVPIPPDATNATLEQFRAYLETLTEVQVDPRLRSKFGLSDIISRTLWEAYQMLDRIKAMDEAGRKRWLRRMLVNNLLDEIERWKAARRDVRREQSIDDAVDDSSCRLRNWLAVEDSTPADHMARQEEALRLLEALSRLPERQREAIVLQRYHGWKLAEIAEHLGCTIGAVAGLHAHGLKKLQQILSEPE